MDDSAVGVGGERTGTPRSLVMALAVVLCSLAGLVGTSPWWGDYTTTAESRGPTWPFVVVGCLALFGVICGVVGFRDSEETAHRTAAVLAVVVGVAVVLVALLIGFSETENGYHPYSDGHFNNNLVQVPSGLEAEDELHSFLQIVHMDDDDIDCMVTEALKKPGPVAPTDQPLPVQSGPSAPIDQPSPGPRGPGSPVLSVPGAATPVAGDWTAAELTDYADRCNIDVTELWYNVAD